MKRLLILVALPFSVSVMADDVQKVLDASAESAVQIYNTAGDVEVRGWSRKQVEVVAELGSGVKELIFEIASAPFELIVLADGVEDPWEHDFIPRFRGRYVYILLPRSVIQVFGGQSRCPDKCVSF